MSGSTRRQTAYIGLLDKAIEPREEALVRAHHLRDVRTLRSREECALFLGSLRAMPADAELHAAHSIELSH